MADVFRSLQKWVSGNSILIVTVAGFLTRLYCPFKVEALVSIAGLQMGETYLVQKVSVGPKLQLVYIINGLPYGYQYFKIL